MVLVFISHTGRIWSKLESVKVVAYDMSLNYTNSDLVYEGLVRSCRIYLLLQLVRVERYDIYSVLINVRWAQALVSENKILYTFILRYKEGKSEMCACVKQVRFIFLQNISEETRFFLIFLSFLDNEYAIKVIINFRIENMQ